MTASAITHSKKQGNPYFGMAKTLGMLQNVTKMVDKPSKSAVFSYLNEAWKECKDALEKRQLFFSCVFSFGDITNREHNLFRRKALKDVDQGGSALRRVFLHCLEWMHTYVPDQFYRFLPIYGEYYNLGASTMFHLLWTDRYKGTVIDTFKIDVNVDRLTTFIADTLKSRNTSENEMRLWAKWLWHIPSAKRKRKFVVTERGLNSVKKKYNNDAKVGDVVTRVSEKQKETIEKDRFVLRCIESLSVKMGWEIATYGTNKQYIGYRKFRSQYLVDTEAVMFSTGKIKALDKTQLLTWLDSLPGGARHRVQRRVVEKSDKGVLTPKSKWVTTKGLNIGEVYIEWMKSKEIAQQTMRNMSKEEKEKLAKENPNELKKMEKAAKVNTGGETMIDILLQMFTPSSTVAEANLKAHTLLENMKLLVPVLIAADISGSTSGHPVNYKGVQFTPAAFIKLLTTVFLLKNPNEELADMFIRFDDTADIITPGVKTDAAAQNRFMATHAKEVDVLTDKKADFVTNFNSVAKWIISRGSTHFNVIADALKVWVDAGGDTWRQTRIEMIQKYPVFLCISDGDLNDGTPAQTILDFQSKMRQWFGWEGVVVIWDVQVGRRQQSQFSGLTNVIHYLGFNPGAVTQIFTNLHDLDIIDIYTVLETMQRTNRYQPVRELVI